MKNRDRNLKNSLRDLDEGSHDSSLQNPDKEVAHPPRSLSMMWQLIFAALIVMTGIFLTRGYSLNPFNAFSQSVVIAQQPSEDLLNRMNNRMVEMGYTGLSHEDLRGLRGKGVTATYISSVRALGFDDLTLDEAVNLAQANASATFIAMMIELGYNLEADEFATLRRAGVTANYTSNLHDLGYRDVTVEQLIRLRQIGVTTALIKNLQEERGPNLPLEEIIRHRISNQ